MLSSSDSTAFQKCLTIKMSPRMLITILAILLLRTASAMEMSLFAGCVLHRDCVYAQSLCFDGYCIKAAELPMNCTRSANCKTQTSFKQNAGRACRDNKCYEIIADKLCVGHVSCNDMQVCIRNHCVPAVATSSKCLGDLLCGIGRRCLNGICYQPQEPAAQENAPS